MLDSNVTAVWGLLLAGGLLIAGVVKATLNRPRCAYCRSPLKSDATACARCGRVQPGKEKSP